VAREVRLMLGDPNEVMEFSPVPNREQMALAVFGLFALAAFSAMILSTARDTLQIISFVFLLLYGVVAGLRLLWLAIRNPRRLMFTRAGLSLDGRLVEWGNIEAFGIKRHRAFSYNVLTLRDPKRFRPDDGSLFSRLGGLHRLWYGGDVSISWTTRDRDAEKFEVLLVSWYARFRPPPDYEPASS